MAATTPARGTRRRMLGASKGVRARSIGYVQPCRTVPLQSSDTDNRLALLAQLNNTLAGATAEEREEIEAAAGQLADAASPKDMCAAHDALRQACWTETAREECRTACEAGGGSKRKLELDADERAAQAEECRTASEAGGGWKRKLDLDADERAAQAEECRTASEAGGGAKRRQDLTTEEVAAQAEQSRAIMTNIQRPSGAAEASPDDENLTTAIWSFIMKMLNLAVHPSKRQMDGCKTTVLKRDRGAEDALFAALLRAASAGCTEIIIGKAALEFVYRYFREHFGPSSVKGCAAGGTGVTERRRLLFRALVQIARRMGTPFFSVSK